LALSCVLAPGFLNRTENGVAQARRINTVYRNINRPLTVLGVERKLFFFAMCMGAATFNMLSSLLGGILMFFLLYLAARWATKTDPQILRFLLSAATFKTQYDPSKLNPITIRRAPNA
jgi:type IV secretory pathway TrbD component